MKSTNPAEIRQSQGHQGSAKSPLELMRTHEAIGQPLAWFEALYQQCNGSDASVPWMNHAPHALLPEALKRLETLSGLNVLMVGCGLGDDAEFIATLDAERVTAFDISETAINRCRERFPDSRVRYEVANLLEIPAHYAAAFDVLIEVRTLQSLPKRFWLQGFQGMLDALKPGGTLLNICNATETPASDENLPIPFSREELAQGVELCGGALVAIEPYTLPNGLHFIGVSQKPAI